MYGFNKVTLNMGGWQRIVTYYCYHKHPGLNFISETILKVNFSTWNVKIVPLENKDVFSHQ